MGGKRFDLSLESHGANFGQTWTILNGIFHVLPDYF